MKTLLLFRHAKSSWEDAAIADHDRPLKPRGIKAAHRMGQLIRDQKIPIDFIACSTALRTRETVRLVLEEVAIQPPVRYLESLFHCPPSEFYTVIQQMDSLIQSLMIVGHNPGLELLLSQLIGHDEEFPTAALAQLNLDLSDWSQFHEGVRAHLIDLWRPKQLKPEEK